MNDTVIGLYSDLGAADRAVHALSRDGVSNAAISVVTASDEPGSVWSPVSVTEADVEERKTANEHVKELVKEGAVGGAALGGVAGLLAGVASLAVPGLGPIFVAGPLASTFASTAAGAIAGATTAGLGAPLLEDLEDQDVDLYREGLRNGGVIVSASADRPDRIKRVMDEAGALATRAQRRPAATR